MKRSAWRLWLPSLLALALLALNCGAALVYTVPVGLRERRMRLQLGEERRRMREFARRISASRRRAAILDQNAVDVKEFYRRVQGERRSTVVETQQRLWRMAEQSGLAPKTLDCTQEALKEVPLTRLRVTMPLSGSYDQLLSFLGRVERAEQFLIVDEVRLRAKRDRARELNIEISTYFHDGGSVERSSMQTKGRQPRRTRR